MLYYYLLLIYWSVNQRFKSNNNLCHADTRWSSFGVYWSFVKGVKTPRHNPKCTSQSMFKNFTHFPVCRKWRRCFCMPWSKITLKTVPTVGNVHNTSLGRGTGSNCKGTGLFSSSSSLSFIVKNLRSYIQPEI